MGVQASQEKRASELRENFQEIFFKSPNEEELSKKLGTLLNQSLSEGDIQRGILPIDIRRIIERQFEYFLFLVKFLLDFLDDTVSKGSALSEQEVVLTKNVLRLLTKIIPILHEQQFKHLSQKIFWDDSNNYSIKEYAEKSNGNSKKIVIYKAEDADMSRGSVKDSSSTPQGIQLLQALITLCFCENFSISEKQGNEKQPEVNLPKDECSHKLSEQFDKQLWCELTCTKKQNPKHENHSESLFENRTCVLQCMLSLIGEQLYTPFSDPNYVNPWVAYLISPMNQQSIPLILSLINFSISYKNNGFLPFQAKIKLKHDFGKKLTQLSSKMLLTLLNTTYNYQQIQKLITKQIPLAQIYDNLSDPTEPESPSLMNQSAQRMVTITELKQVFENESANIVKNYENPTALLAILVSIIDHLERPIKNDMSIFPEKNEDLHNSQEMIGILYKFISLNPQMKKWIVASSSFGKIVKIIIFHLCQALQNKNQNLYFTLLGYLTYFTQIPEFTSEISQNLDFSLQLEILPIISGTYGDLIITSIATLVRYAYDTHQNSYSYNLMSVLLNVSPFIKNISELSASKLSQLLTMFTDYKMLFLDQYNPFCLLKLIQVYENLFSFYPEENAAFIHEVWGKRECILKAKKISFSEKNIIHIFPQVKEHILQTHPSLQQLDQNYSEPNQEMQRESILYTQFMQTWRNFKWKVHLSKTDTRNLAIALQAIDKYVRAKKTPLGDINTKYIRKILKQEDFKKSLIIKNNVTFEIFKNDQFFQQLQTYFAFSQLIKSNLTIPYFDISQIQFNKQSLQSSNPSGDVTEFQDGPEMIDTHTNNSSQMEKYSEDMQHLERELKIQKRPSTFESDNNLQNNLKSPIITTKQPFSDNNVIQLQKQEEEQEPQEEENKEYNNQ